MCKEELYVCTMKNTYKCGEVDNEQDELDEVKAAPEHFGYSSSPAVQNQSSPNFIIALGSSQLWHLGITPSNSPEQQQSKLNFDPFPLF